MVPKPIGADKQRRARTLDESLGAELQELRTRRAWSQQKLAELVGYDESYIRQLERGVKSATLRTLSNLACGLFHKGVSAGEPFGAETSKASLPEVILYLARFPIRQS